MGSYKGEIQTTFECNFLLRSTLCVPVGAIVVEDDLLVYESDEPVKMEALDNQDREGSLFAANAKEKKKEWDRMVEMVKGRV